MKGEIIECKCCESVLDFTHGFFYFVKRIYVPKFKIAITPYRGEIYINEKFKKGGEDKFIKEVEIPDYLIKVVLEFLKVKKEIKKLEQEFKKLIE